MFHLYLQFPENRFLRHDLSGQYQDNKLLEKSDNSKLTLKQQKSSVLSSPQEAKSKRFTMHPSQGLHRDFNFHCSHSTLPRPLATLPKELFKEALSNPAIHYKHIHSSVLIAPFAGVFFPQIATLSHIQSSA